MANDTLPTFPGDARPVAPPPAPSPSELIGLIEQTLIDFLDSEVAAIEEIDPALGDLARTARDCVLAGGKRLRPVFAHWGWRGVRAHQPVASTLPALAALELLHAFALVHDDVMDRSATRRGRPTAHRVLADQHVAAGRTGDPDHFGTAGAVLVGDLCLVWADRLLAGAGLPAASVLAARRCYDQMRIEAIAGQYLDILGDTDAANWSVDRALRVARHKTASYTVQRPLLFGAALAGGAAGPAGPVTAAYSRYGIAVGEAFQLRDDLLGVYGDPRRTGKPAGDDLRTGKPTVLLLLADQFATAAQRAELARGRAGTVGVGRLAEVVTATGATARVEQMIEARVADALDSIGTAPIDPVARRALADLAVRATDRRA
ncbi:polyprenyl synthetase family protein [Polymorphospora lycopeni]|uniref:Polyprenyl synthetase family protein n=1 Tax=Polymorphospora lycopeni TaxID=3140240 RepID=A0ABV5CIB8_9ACTN